MPPKKRKTGQPTILEMYGKKPSVSVSEGESTGAQHESKQNILVDLSLQQVQNESGIDWTIWFNFDIHFIGTSSQQVDLASEVEIVSPGLSASTSKTSTPIDTEDDNSDADDAVSFSTSDGQWKFIFS